MPVSDLYPKPSVRWVVAALIHVRQALHGWTSEGSGAYSCPLDSYTHPTTERADRGLYRLLTEVWEGTTPLVQRGSLGSVQASGGYYHNGSTLYVKTSGAVNPDTLAMLQAVGIIMVATSAERGADFQFDAQIDGRSLPSLSVSRQDLVRGISAAASGDLTLQNADGFWDYLIDSAEHLGWQWTNNLVIIQIGGEGLDPYSDYDSVAVFTVAEWPKAGDLGVTFPLRARPQQTRRAFPQTTYDPTESGLANWLDIISGGPSRFAVLETLSGQYIPMMWGTVYEAPGQYIGSGSDGVFPAADIYILFDPNLCTSATFEWLAVHAIHRETGVKTTLTLDTHYRLPAIYDYYVSVNQASYPNTTYDIVADIRSSLRTAGAIALDILTRCGSVATVDGSDFSAVDVAQPVELGIWVGPRPGEDTLSAFRTGAELLDLLQRSVPMFVWDTGLELTAAVWDPSFDLAATPTLTDADIRRFEPVQESAPLSTRQVVRYARRIYSDIWMQKSSTSSEAAAAQQESETTTVDTALVYSSDAEALAGRLGLIERRPKVRYEIETGPVLFPYSVGQKVRIVRDRAPGDLIMEIEAIDKSLAALSVRAIVGNMMGLGESVKRVAPDGTADWASASADERRQYAFAADDTTQMVDTADRSTYRQAVGW